MSTYLKGVEMPLPEGERVLWQGSPGFREMALHAFHARKIAIYFLGLIALTAFLNRGAPSFVEAMMSSAGLLALGGLMAVAFAVTVAMLSSRTTLYAITDKRVVMKVGIALPIVLNIPLRVIESVGIKQRASGTGNISLRLANKSRVAYAVLWPHARPWRIRYPEPLLRDLSAIAAVGETLRAALLASAESGGAEPTLAPASSTATPGNIVLAAS